MRPVRRAAAVRNLDRLVIEQVGLPGRLLMETAARESARILHDRWPIGPVAVLCGPGNNGGDGYALARWLHLWGRPVRIWAPRGPEGDDARANRALCERLAIPLVSLDHALQSVTIAVDALLGTGQRSAPQGAMLEGVKALRDAHARGVRVVALDLPTGLSADTGQPTGTDTEVVQADLTLTFGAYKPGLLAWPGMGLAGEVQVIDIGLDLARLVDPAALQPDLGLMEPADIRAGLPASSPGHAKWDKGHVAILALGGAAVLACEGALASGVGLVTLLCPPAERSRRHGLPPEVILAEPEALDPERHDVLVLGPALGAHAGPVLIRTAGFPGPQVIDADAVPLLAETPPAKGPRVLTPHTAEAARLLGLRRSRVEADRFETLRLLARHGLPVLKGPGTLIGGPPGTLPLVCGVADSRLGIAGSGDVLAGLIGGLIARAHVKEGIPLQAVVAAAVGLHAAAAAHLGPRPRASQLSDAISRAWSDLESRP